MAAPKGNQYALGHEGYKPEVILDYELLDDLCKIQCTEAEICAILKTNTNTLTAAILRDTGKNFLEYYDEKRADGKKSLRRKQYQAAVDQGNVTMLVWLGKQWLGQTDKQQIDMAGKEEIHVTFEEDTMSDDESE